MKTRVFSKVVDDGEDIITAAVDDNYLDDVADACDKLERSLAEIAQDLKPLYKSIVDVHNKLKNMYDRLKGEDIPEIDFPEDRPEFDSISDEEADQYYDSYEYYVDLATIYESYLEDIKNDVDALSSYEYAYDNLDDVQVVD